MNILPSNPSGNINLASKSFLNGNGSPLIFTKPNSDTYGRKIIYIIDPFVNIVDEFFAFVNVFQMQNELTIEYGNNFFNFCYLSDISGKRITNNMKREAGSSILKACIPPTKPGIYFLSFELDNGRVFTTKVFLN